MIYWSQISDLTDWSPKKIPVVQLHRTPVGLRRFFRYGRLQPTLADQAAVISAQLRRAAKAERRRKRASRSSPEAA